MAIAFDATSTSGNTNGNINTATWSHTCSSGSNRILFVAGSNADNISVGSVTYGGTSMTKIREASNGLKTSLWYLVNPASGANNVVVTATGSAYVGGCAISFTGAKQSGVPDASAINNSGTTSISQSVTTVDDNCWLVSTALSPAQNGNPAAGTGTTFRNKITVNSDAKGFMAIGDSNGAKTPAGSHSMAWTFDTTPSCMVIASFAPAVTTSIKSINGLAKASVKSVNGLAIASVKSFNGLT